MSDFKARFHAAVRSVAAEMEAMDDEAFERMLAEHRDSDIAQILREIDFEPEPFFIGKWRARFITAQARPFMHSLELAEVVSVADEQNYAGTPDECLTAA